ncbi:hypothetical protein ACFFP0_14030 [Rhizobium puerariae]|uniref:Uncharacterized protein n=1 Tax=Rhizobium puerariae TaxID=1585791 RepID=A0ABV6AH77_9HYPH
MAVQSSKPDPVRKLLADLAACQALSDSLAATAPSTCIAHGGVDRLISKYGYRTGAGFWSLDLVNLGEAAVSLWEEMAREHRTGFMLTEVEE